LPHINLNDNPVEYTLRISRRNKSIRLTIHPGGEMVVSAPSLSYQRNIEDFLLSKARWIIEKLNIFKSMPPRVRQKSNRAQYLEQREPAREIARERLEHFNRFYGFTYQRVSIKNQKTRWGSCSKQGNLNFNYKIALLPPELCDYIIVHELCHLRELNHGKKFWDLVAKTIPNHKDLRKELHKRHLL